METLINFSIWANRSSSSNKQLAKSGKNIKKTCLTLHFNKKIKVYSNKLHLFAVSPKKSRKLVRYWILLDFKGSMKRVKKWSQNCLKQISSKQLRSFSNIYNYG